MARRRVTRPSPSKKVKKEKKTTPPKVEETTVVMDEPKEKEVVVVEKRVVTPPPKMPTMNEHGLMIGGDSALVVDAMIEGGSDRHDVASKALSKMGTTTTRSGRQKNISSMMSALIAKMEAKGYTVESTWRLVPPAATSTNGDGSDSSDETVEEEGENTTEVLASA